MPRAGDTRISGGYYERWDPQLGQGGQWTIIPQNRLGEFEGIEAPENYASPGMSTPAGKRIQVNPQTGLREFVDIPVESVPIPPSPEEIAQQQFNQRLTPFIDESGNIRQDLQGGDFNLTSQQLRDLNTQGNTEQLNAALANLQGRQDARDVGFLGAFDDPSRAQAFLQSQGTRLGDVDAYGQLTPQGRQRQLATTPTLATGQFDEPSNLAQNPDVAAAVAAGQVGAGREHFDAFGQREGRREFTTGTKFQPIIQSVRPQELLTQQYRVDPGRTVAATETVPQTQLGVTQPTTAARTTVASEIFPRVKEEEVTAAKQEDLSDFVTAQQEQVDVQSTVRGQIASLTQQFDEGEIPSWAAPSIRLAEQRLAARGMGASSMAGAAILQAAMEAATPIAAADAQTFARFQQANLNNRQQAEVLNAQQTLQLDLANLSNQQQANVLNSQQRVQALFNDQAAINSSRQFNARNEQQNDQYFATMFNETSKFNAQQQNAIAQFNAGQTNTMEQFNSTLENQREQFNTKNSILIDQSNAVWRRQINTQQTALQNAANQMNVMNRFNMSQTALNNQWQQFRDNEFWATTTSRDNDAFSKQLTYDSFIYNKKANADFLDTAGSFAFDTVSKLGQEFLPGFIDSLSDDTPSMTDFDISIPSNIFDDDTGVGSSMLFDDTGFGQVDYTT